MHGNCYAKQYYGALNTERISQSAYTFVSGRVSLLDGLGNHWSFALWGKIFANNEYLSYDLAQGNPEDGALGLDYALLGEPRSDGLEVTVRC
jgi:hypothetical protein